MEWHQKQKRSFAQLHPRATPPVVITSFQLIGEFTIPSAGAIRRLARQAFVCDFPYSSRL
jgi:hypothetical protein